MALVLRVGSGSRARYYPFGGWRTEPTAGLTDRGFTGHMHNNLGNAPEDIGLIYMAARWYSPTLGRFISADTLVPDPANPQGWNRYTYTINNPLALVDPSGHCWGFASGLRNTAFGATCNNIDTAWSIVTSPDASVAERLPAATYLGVGVVATGTAVVGTAVASVGCLTGAGTMVCAGAGSAATAVSADGDPTNEAAAVANGVSTTFQTISAGGNPANGLQAGLNSFARASEFGINTYSRLRNAISGTGLQAHHIIEKRFAQTLGIQVLWEYKGYTHI